MSYKRNPKICLGMYRNREIIITFGKKRKSSGLSFLQDGVVRKPPARTRRSWSDRQVNHLTRVEQAKEYGRLAMADAEKRAYYLSLLPKWKKRRRIKNAGVYQIAICDFYHPPVIEEVELIAHSNNQEFSISVIALDNFRVEGVWVSFLNHDGTMAEEGEASNRDYGYKYEYLLHDPTLIRTDVIVVIRARDVPGNLSEKKYQILKENEIKFVPLMSD